MRSTTECYLRPSVQAEPLFNQWYAWVHLIPPATGAINVARRHIEVMTSYINSPLLHAAASGDPAMRGGPFLDLGGERVEEVEHLLQRTRSECSDLLELSQAFIDLHRMLETRARGHAMEPLYAEIPPPLQGYVELCYDMAHRPGYRILESLLYRSPYYREDCQALACTDLHGDGERPFAMSTPRLADPNTLQLNVPFADPVLDDLFRMTSRPAPYGDIVARLDLAGERERLFQSFFTTEPPTCPEPFHGEGVRVRYFGHACVLIETAELSVLVDPVISYRYDCELPRFTYDDLPEIIDYVLITHAHHDHILLETLLQLRHKVRRVIVGRNIDGCIADPSLQLLLRKLGFADVIEIRDLDEIAVPGGAIIGVPFLGEHHDIAVQSKTCFIVKLLGRSVMVAADSCNIQPRLYEHIARLVGRVDILFVAMECEGAPLSWIYGPLFPDAVAREHDRSRLARGCDSREALALAEIFQCREVYIYAMGQEPWLRHLLDNPLTEDSAPIIHSRRLIESCRERGKTAEFLFGQKELLLDKRTLS